MRIRENPMLEGTCEVCLGASAPHREAHTVILRKGSRACGAVVAGTSAEEDVVEVDKYLRLHLRATNDDIVTVEAAVFPAASVVYVSAPPPWNAADNLGLLRSELEGRPVCAGQKIGLLTLSGRVYTVEVERVEGGEIAEITSQTDLRVVSAVSKLVGANGITWQDVGGLETVVRRVRELVEYPLRSPEVFEQLGISVPRGIILYGPPGTGKTLIAKALCNEVGATFFTIQGPEIISPYYGEAEGKLRSIFEKARANTPAVIVIDELDALAPKRDRTHGDLEPRVVATLLTLMDGLSDLRGVVVVGTTNRLESIDPALRRPGRFEHELHVGAPNVDGRQHILAIHTKRMRLSQPLDLRQIAERTSGFVGADISSLCQEAGYCALRRVLPAEALQRGEIAVDATLSVTPEDFEEALKTVRPSALRELVVEAPQKATWDDLGGLSDVQRVLMENVVEPLRHPERLRALGIAPPCGVLLYGPPGTGKTTVARVVANEAQASFIPVHCAEVRAQWFAKGEDSLSFTFRKAREVTPCIILLDEVDAIAECRSATSPHLGALLSQLLAELEGIRAREGIFVLATTNMVDLLDPAVFRPGRFDCQIEMPVPQDDEARLAIFRIHTRRMPLAPEVELAELARLAVGLSGAEIAEICRQAGMLALRGAGAQADSSDIIVRSEHFHEAIVRVKHSGPVRKRRHVGFAAPNGSTTPVSR